jgi:hypothetical protein
VVAIDRPSLDGPQSIVQSSAIKVQTRSYRIAQDQQGKAGDKTVSTAVYLFFGYGANRLKESV